MIYTTYIFLESEGLYMIDVKLDLSGFKTKLTIEQKRAEVMDLMDSIFKKPATLEETSKSLEAETYEDFEKMAEAAFEAFKRKTKEQYDAIAKRKNDEFEDFCKKAEAEFNLIVDDSKKRRDKFNQQHQERREAFMTACTLEQKSWFEYEKEEDKGE